MESFVQSVFFWFLLGIVLAVLEMFLPAVVLIFFALGAFVTAGISFFYDISLNLQIAFFMGSSVLAIMALRNRLKDRFFQGDPDSPVTLEDEFIGKQAVAETKIDKNKPGTIVFKGTIWAAKSEDPISPKEEVEIIDKDSITLFVQPIKQSS